MDVCGNCGRARNQGNAFCTGCGRRFADEDQRSGRSDSAFGTSDSPGPAGSYAPTETHQRAGPFGSSEPYRPAEPYPSAAPRQPAASYEPTPPGRVPGPSDRHGRSGTDFTPLMFRPAVVAAAVILFVAAAATSGVLLYTRHHASQTEAVQNSAHSTRTTPPAPPTGGAPQSGQSDSALAQSPSDTSPSPSDTSPSPSDTSSSASAGSTVTVAAGVSQDANASSIAGFLGQYFTAINARDYQSYFSLLSPQLQQGTSQAQFDSGYRSTVDSNETLVSISTASDGDLAAEVTFTSHQDPADSPDQSESCTNWDISLFLAQSNSGYVIDPAPAGYQASYQPC